MPKHFDLYRAELRNARAEYKALVNSINSNSDLSPEGKSKHINEAKQSFDVKRNDLKRRLNTEGNEKVQNLQKLLKGKPKESFRDRIRKKAKEHSTLEFASDDLENTSAIIEALEENTRALNRNMFLGSISHLDDKGLNKIAQYHFNAGDSEKVYLIRDLYNMRGEQLSANTVNGYIRTIEKQNLTPEQHKIKENLKAIETEKQHLEMMIARADSDSAIMETLIGEIPEELSDEE